MMSSKSHTLIFVYGTLKRGFCRSHHLADQRFLDLAQTVSAYTMYDCGEYPGLVRNAETGVSIQGELWSVDEQGVSLLDEVEGVAENWFARRQIELQHPTVSETVEAYYFQGDVSRLSVYGDNWRKAT